ncbi:O-antigen ligase family protein [Desulfovibrio ferrophilus]|uniref:O-antigen ligase family protein n=1 Tax=Desulfovibrio ferrophilus TaxID=241368 RepID=UPI000F84AAB0|nr:O-antigen ligase family protein [Desulfovibrio ferrophilus]
MSTFNSIRTNKTILFGLLSFLCIVFQEFIILRLGIHWSPPSICIVIFSILVLSSLSRQEIISLCWNAGFIFAFLLSTGLFTQSIIHSYLNEPHGISSRIGSIAYTSGTIGIGAIFFIVVSHIHSQENNSTHTHLPKILFFAGGIAAAVTALLHLFMGLETFEPTQVMMKRPLLLTNQLFQASTGLIGKRGGYGILCIGSIAIATQYLFKKEYCYKKLFTLSIVLLTIAIGMSGFRSSYAALIIYIFILLYFILTSRLKTANFRMLAIAIPLIIMIASIVPAKYNNTISNSIDQISKSQRSLKHRIDQNRIAIDAIKSNPLFGRGIEFEKEYYLNNFTIHNTYLSVAGSHGLALASLLILLWVLPIYRFTTFYIQSQSQEQRNTASIWIANLASVFFIGLFSNIMMSYTLWSILSIAHLELLMLRKQHIK